MPRAFPASIRVIADGPQASGDARTGWPVNTAGTLRRVSFLADLTDAELEELGGSLRLRRCRKGETIFTEGDDGDCMYVIEEGWVKIALTSPEGKEAILRLCGAGDFFGEMALLDGEPRSADARAQAPTRLMLLGRADFLRFLERRPSVAVRLLASLSRRLRHTTQQVHDAAFLDIPGRLASVLADLGDPPAGHLAAGMGLPRPMTQSELASLIGATRESVNKWLGFYERQGFIRRTKDGITVLDPEQLRKRAY
jgi:CRP/FNR family transcriptional regulator, cyclic AMP receptor protein